MACCIAGFSATCKAVCPFCTPGNQSQLLRQLCRGALQIAEAVKLCTASSDFLTIVEATSHAENTA